MVWKRIKGLLGADVTESCTPPAKTASPEGGAVTGQGLPAIPVIPAEANPWGVPLLDVRPITQGMTSTSRDPQCAANAVSFGQDDGRSFIGLQPQGAPEIALELSFPIDRMLADGVLFTPREMEHKWAIFVHGGQIILVRSWRRQVAAIAGFKRDEGQIHIRHLRGELSPGGDPAFQARLLDFLLRSHALGLTYPAPVPPELGGQPQQAALWCMNLAGKLAFCAAVQDVPRKAPEKPLRSHSLLHIAAARGDLPGIEAALAAGIPIDLPAGDGLTPLHWALARRDNRAAFELLLRHGCPIDARSSEGATPLMNAVQSGSLDECQLLLDHGADANARDLRGFTALHRAAEMGHIELVRLLLQRGAVPGIEANGLSPRSLAEKHKRSDVLALLDQP